MSELILTPGVYEMDAARYHADPCLRPSLSASMARLLESRSPMHAREAHPRLNPNLAGDEATEAMQEGTALHSLILEKTDLLEVCDFPDWRTKPAQEARKTAISAGKIPVLAKRAAALYRCAERVSEQLAAHKEASDAFTNGKAETNLIWEDETPWGPIWCRSRVDWLGANVIDDLKTTPMSAHPNSWGKKLTQDGYATQAAFYLRGCQRLGLPIRQFRFIVVETKPPFGLCVVQPAPDLMAIAEDAVERAMETWGWCLKHDRWPGYPDRICHIEARSWDLAQHEETKATKPRGYMPSSPLVTKAGMPFA